MGNYHIGPGYKVLNNMADTDIKPVFEAPKPNKKEPPQPTSLFIETTITRITNNKNAGFLINCDPPLFNKLSYEETGKLYLSRSNTNFIELYNKLKRDKTYKFEFINFVDGGLNIILNVMEVDTHKIRGSIKGFLDISHEKLNLNHSREIIIDGHDNKIRILVNHHDMNKFVIGNNYEIEYVKDYEENFYRATTYENLDIDLDSNICEKKMKL